MQSIMVPPFAYYGGKQRLVPEILPLLDYRKQFGWNTKDIEQIVAVTGKRENTKYKTECLTWNYELPKPQLSLF